MDDNYAKLRRLVIDWLDDNVHFGEAESKITDDELSFLKNGILTSLGFVSLIVHLEDTLGIRVDRKSLTRENFDGLGKVVRYVLAHPQFKGVP
jgi:acyl carrier protein